jgi:hypothetical protein
MSPKLDEQLCEKYPKLFIDRHGSPSKTLMCFGFEHGDGWYKILDALCGQIQNHLDWINRKEETVKQVVVIQVKEKFGGLRFYYEGGDKVVDGMVRMAESWAAVTCEQCGKPGQMRTGGWIKTLCDEHANGREPINNGDDNE